MPLKRLTQIPMPDEKKVGKAMDTLLEGAYWPGTLASQQAYVRIQDDCDGDLTQCLSVGFGQDGDAWIQTHGPMGLRFRTSGGGGMSLRVRNALLVLAEAIRRDNEDRPQDGMRRAAGA